MTTFLMWYFGGVIIAYYSLKLTSYVIEGEASNENLGEFLRALKYASFSWLMFTVTTLITIAVIINRNFSRGSIKDWWSKIKSIKVPKWL